MTASTPDGPTIDSGLRLALIPGVVPTAWTRTWRDRLPDHPLELVHLTARDAAPALLTGTVDAALLRLPVDRDQLHAIPLYTEVTVLVLPKDHLLTAVDEITAQDLADQTLITPADDVLGWAEPPGEPSLLPTPATTADAVELVAAGVGLLATPMSLARLHHRKDLTYRPITDAPGSSVALAWTRARQDDPLIEELVGIVRGRTVNSSRGRGSPACDQTAPRGGSKDSTRQTPRSAPQRPSHRTSGRPSGGRRRGR